MHKIFILHGWTYTTIKWNGFLEYIKNAGYEPVMFSIPGLTEPSTHSLTLDDYVEWLHGKLETEDQPVVIGHSNGGRIALAFNLKYPGKIRQLILIDSAGVFHNEWPIRLKRAIFKTLADIGKKVTSIGIFRKLLYALAGEGDYEHAPLHMRETMANLIAVDLVLRLPEITIPTLIIWGGQDTATPLSDGNLMHRLIAGSELYIIERAGHSPHYTHTKEVADKILKTLKKNGI